MSRICLVGAGNIARVHADALSALPPAMDGSRHRIAAVVDPDLSAARRLCPPGGTVHGTLDAAIEADGFERAHVLTPPATHAAIAHRLLDAGKAVLLEKPLATDRDAAEALRLAAAGRLGVNQNFVFHPAFVRLRAAIDSGSLGRPRSVSCLYSMPLRQLAARQFNHWMFAEPVNILLEQAVHPLSQIAALAGAPGAVQAIAGASLDVGGGRFHPSFDVTLRGALLPAQLRFAVGESFPFWQLTAICDDGVAVADMVANRMLRHRRTRWLDLVDGLVSGAATAGDIGRDAARQFGAGMLAVSGLRPRNDPFFLGMRDSIGAFHRACDAGQPPPLDAAFGAGLVDTCWRIAAAAGLAPASSSALPPPSLGLAAPAVIAAVRPDIAVLGGTGFIGTATVAAMRDAGLRVVVMARGAGGPEQPGITWRRGSISDPASVREAVCGAPVVVNLAHGGGGGSRDAIRDAMLCGAKTVAGACLETGARLVHVSSIAALPLGSAGTTTTGATGPDARDRARADYARAKILTERRLASMAHGQGLRLVVLRPGLVVGEGASPFHGGLGFYNTEGHCIGWNDGRNPLPFVLVEDVADAILLACDRPGIEGRSYNLVGGVRLSARAYLAALAEAQARPHRFHPQSPGRLWATELGKWLVKRGAGRRTRLPSLHDLRSRGLRAGFDVSDAERDLGWQPVGDRERFLERAIRVHARPS